MGMNVNITFHVADTVSPQFLEWVGSVLKNAVLEEFPDGSPSLFRVMYDIQPGCSTYAFQFIAASGAVAESWLERIFSRCMTERSAEWGENVLPFVTMLDPLNL